MTLADLITELQAMRADYHRLDAYVRGAALLDLVIAKAQTVDPEELDGLDGPDLDTAEAGRLLGQSQKTGERKCRSGEIRARKTSEHGEWRITRAALQEYRSGKKRRPQLKFYQGGSDA